MKPDGKFDRERAWVIAQGFTQRPGMDYFEVTAPVVKFDSLQLLLAIGNSLNWEFKMMDIKSTFVNSDLDKEIYMQQPEGFNDGTDQVLKLHWALYGLKQAGWAWHQHLHGILLNFGYIQSLTD